jgi:hypothetical protein
MHNRQRNKLLRVSGFSSGSLNFSFRILQYIKRGMKTKTNLVLAPYGFRSNSYMSERYRNRKSHTKTQYNPWIRFLGKAPDLGSATLVTQKDSVLDPN